jgi:hypothetical protein
MPINARLLTALLAIAVWLTTGAGQGNDANLPRTEYYAGVCQTSFVGGNLFLESSFLLERVIDPGSSSIVEHMLLFDRSGAFSENNRVLNIEGDNFVLHDSGTPLGILGELSGEEWRWRLVSYSARDGQGHSVESDSTHDEAGLYRETLIRDSEDRVVVYIDEYASLLSELQYRLLLEQLQAQNPAIRQA